VENQSFWEFCIRIWGRAEKEKKLSFYAKEARDKMGGRGRLKKAA